MKNPAIFPQPQKKMDPFRLWEVQEKISENLDRFVDMAIRYELAINPEFKITIFESVELRATPKFSTMTFQSLGLQFNYTEYGDDFCVVHFSIVESHFKGIRPDIDTNDLDLTVITEFMSVASKNWAFSSEVTFSGSTSTDLVNLTEAQSAGEYDQNLINLTRLSNWLSANVGWHGFFYGL